MRLRYGRSGLREDHSHVAQTERSCYAVAGFAGEDLSVEVKENTLTIRGNKQSGGEEESDLIYQGIAERNFERNFQLADHVQIKGASLENGLLQVDLLRVVPGDEAPSDTYNDRQEGRP